MRRRSRAVHRRRRLSQRQLLPRRSLRALWLSAARRDQHDVPQARLAGSLRARDPVSLGGACDGRSRRCVRAGLLDAGGRRLRDRSRARRSDPTLDRVHRLGRVLVHRPRRGARDRRTHVRRSSGVRRRRRSRGLCEHAGRRQPRWARHDGHARQPESADARDRRQARGWWARRVRMERHGVGASLGLAAAERRRRSHGAEHRGALDGGPRRRRNARDPLGCARVLEQRRAHRQHAGPLELLEHLRIAHRRGRSRRRRRRRAHQRPVRLRLERRDAPLGSPRHAGCARPRGRRGLR